MFLVLSRYILICIFIYLVLSFGSLSRYVYTSYLKNITTVVLNYLRIVIKVKKHDLSFLPFFTLTFQSVPLIILFVLELEIKYEVGVK